LEPIIIKQLLTLSNCKRFLGLLFDYFAANN
jgi:hypothetical protein